MTMKCAAAPASHNAATVAAADANRELQHRRQNDDAIRLVENALRNTIGGFENFLHDLPSIFDPVGFFVLSEKRNCERQHNPQAD